MMDVVLFITSTALTSYFYYYYDHDDNHKQHDDYKNDDNNNNAIVIPQYSSKDELICIVDENNNVLSDRKETRYHMRLHNLWHRATYVLLIHTNHNDDHNDDTTNTTTSSSNSPYHDYLHNTYVIIQRRSYSKDYCPGKLDPLPGGVVQYNESYYDNAIREMEEEMNILTNQATFQRLFVFPYQDDHVRVYGELYELYYHGTMNDIIIQKEEVESIETLSLYQLRQMMEANPNDFMPDSYYAMKLYYQYIIDKRFIKRRLLVGYSSSDYDHYQLRTKPSVIFFDCDDCLYFDQWKTANMLTKKIDDWCIERHQLPSGAAYELYKKHGTALKGLLTEGYLPNTEENIDEFLRYVHDIPIHELIKPDPLLRHMLLRIDPTIPRYIFTASVSHHAKRCLQALGIDDLFMDHIIDCKDCDYETKHSAVAFAAAMRIAGVANPESCVFFDDNMTNISAARAIGWRCILVGTIGRDCGKFISSDDAELQVTNIHHIEDVMPELFPNSNVYLL